MTALQEAVQKFIEETKLDRIEFEDWPRDSQTAFEALRTALEQHEADKPFQPDWTNYRQGVEDGKAEALAQQGEPVAQARLGMKDGLAMALSVVELYGMKGDVIYREIAKLRDGIAAAPSPVEQRCTYCDGTGDVHGIDGEWRGTCPCAAAPAPQAQPVKEMPHGWVVNWPNPNGGTKPVYHASSVKPKFGAELDGKLTIYAVYTHPQPAPQAQQGEAVYQYQMADGSWIDQIKDSYDYNRKHAPNATVRVVYTAAPAPQPALKEQP